VPNLLADERCCRERERKAVARARARRSEMTILLRNGEKFRIFVTRTLTRAATALSVSFIKRSEVEVDDLPVLVVARRFVFHASNIVANYVRPRTFKHYAKCAN
jgi:hypothetical protein